LVFIALHDAVASDRTILVFGDSLSAALGLPAEQGWVALLQERVHSQGYGYEVINASVSGETSAGGLERLPRALQQHHPAIVVLELGANDGLRGLPVDAMRTNLAQMIYLAEQAGARVMLLGIRIPPNYGPRYTQQFTAAYTDLAREHRLPFVPFLLKDVALKPALMQGDGMHPNAAGEPHVLENVWPVLKPLLKKN
jgi:acyl-CoA thioesterase I